MHDQAFHQAIREGPRAVPRRGVMGLVAALSAIAVGLPTAEARRKKRKKCKNGTTKCGKKCFNLKADSANCGACGATCPTGQVCNGGICGCPAGQSLISGACIPRFGCTPELDSCTFGREACPGFTNEQDAHCYVSGDGEPFCGTSRSCVTLAPDAICSVAEGQPRIFIPCTLCNQPGDTGACVRAITRVRD